MNFSGVNSEGQPYCEFVLNNNDGEKLIRITLNEGNPHRARLTTRSENIQIDSLTIDTDHIPRIVEALMMVYNSLEENIK